jgi:hypothetical protein
VADPARGTEPGSGPARASPPELAFPAIDSSGSDAAPDLRRSSANAEREERLGDADPVDVDMEDSPPAMTAETKTPDEKLDPLAERVETKGRFKEEVEEDEHPLLQRRDVWERWRPWNGFG